MGRGQVRGCLRTCLPPQHHRPLPHGPACTRQQSLACPRGIQPGLLCHACADPCCSMHLPARCCGALAYPLNKEQPLACPLDTEQPRMLHASSATYVRKKQLSRRTCSPLLSPGSSSLSTYCCHEDLPGSCRARGAAVRIWSVVSRAESHPSNPAAATRTAREAAEWGQQDR